MKKSKFILLTFTLLVFVGFSLFFFPVEVMGADFSDRWNLPLSAKNFVEKDGRGIRLYIHAVYDEVSGGGFSGDLNYAYMRAVKGYQFDDGELKTGTNYLVGSNFFDSDLLNQIREVSVNWYEGNAIQEQYRIYVYFDVERQVFVYEYYGLGYLDYWMEQYFVLFDDNKSYNRGYEEGYDVGYEEGKLDGYDEGYDEGYQEGIIVNHEAAYYEGYDTGYGVGYEVGYDDARPEMDILLITLIMFILSIFVYFKFRIKWVLIATILLWFVPIFLVENLFIKIFSTIMIIVTIVITFFNDREEDFIE